VRIEPEHWREEALDPWYRMNYRVVDADGTLMDQGRDLMQLIGRYQEDTRSSLGAADDDSPACDGLTRWTIGDLPLSWRSKQAGVEIESWPALVERGDTVSVELLDYRESAAIEHRKGLLRLLRLHSSQSVRQLKKQLLRGNEFNLVVAGAGLEREALLEDLVDACFMRAMLPTDLAQLPRSESAFQRCLDRGRSGLLETGLEYEKLLAAALATLADIRQLLAASSGRHHDSAQADIEQQLGELLWPCFLRDTPFDWIRHYPRYLKAILIRLQRFSGQVQKDNLLSQQLADLQQPLSVRLAENANGLMLNGELLKLRWMLEEFRVSLFAQSLGTSLPVSAKRLKQQWLRVDQVPVFK
jgi:ATP-dependent helicase HrpA